MLSRVLTSATLLLASACAQGEAPVPEAAETPPAFDEHFALVFRCPDGTGFVARARGDSVEITYGAESFVLPPAVAASGARYGDGGREFWSRGEDARLETPGYTLDGCAGVAADDPWEVSRLLGYDLRAIGQEPGWMVEVESGRRMHVLADYGEIDFITGPPLEEEANDGRIYRAERDGGEVLLRFSPGGCQDVMSGEEFPARATLELDGRLLEGCGRWLDR